MQITNRNSSARGSMALRGLGRSWLFRCLAAASMGAVVVAQQVPKGAAPTIAQCIEHLSKAPPGDRPAERHVKAEDRDPCWALQAVHYSDGSNVNKQAQIMHGVDLLRNKPFSLTGKSVTVAVVDGGHALASHLEFGDRVSLEDMKSAETAYLNGHATHVTGTVTASGDLTKQRTQGMAPASNVLSYYWARDTEKLTKAAGHGATISNHSYGNIPAWSYGPQKFCPVNWVWYGRDQDADSLFFGRYDDEAAAFDRAALEQPLLSIFVAAGNERGWQGDPDKLDKQFFDGRYCVWSTTDSKWIVSTKPRAGHSRKGGFDTMAGHAVAKNVITVGAMADITEGQEWGRKDIRLTDFSSFGPTDDGRIKPDVIANGDKLFSTGIYKKCELDPTCDPTAVPEAERQVFVWKSGTSMASPVAAGIGALLNELSLRKQGRTLFSDEMKAVLVQTALSRLESNGPTYDAGWGAIMGVPAANVLLGNNGTLERHSLAKAKTLDIPLEWKEARDARITVVWLDAAGEVAEEALAVVDDPAAKLVDRLAVSLRAPDEQEYFPWSLDRKSPSAAPTRGGPNTVDNVIRFDVAKADKKPGKWHLRIDAYAAKSAKVTVAVAAYGLVPSK